MGFVANLVTTRTNATQKSARVTDSNAKRMIAKKTKLALKTPRNGDKGGKGGEKGGGKDGTPTHNPKRRSSATATSPSPATADPKKRLQGNNASPEESNCKKRRLARMAKSLMAAGLYVKFLDGE